MELKTNLEGKSLRSRIDGINFVSIKSYKFLNDLSKNDEYNEKSAIIKDCITTCASVLHFNKKDDCVTVLRNKLTINLNELHGIYIEGYFKGCDYFLMIQFKGYFFVQPHAFDLCRSIMIKMTEIYNNYFRISLVDVAQDFLLSTEEILPNPANPPEDLRYCFNYKCFDYNEKRKSSLKNTGFVISSSRFKITVYDKILENKGARKPDKKKYYEDIFGGHEVVTRVELRLKQELCKTFASLFYIPYSLEEDFIERCLIKLYRKHKLRYRPPHSKDTDWRRWPVHPNWEYLFGRINKKLDADPTMPDYKYTSGNEDVTKPLNLLIETLANNAPNITSEELLKKLELLNFDQIVERVKITSQKRKETQAILQQQKDELLKKYGSGDWLDLTPGDSFITSPVKRNSNENSNIYGDHL